MEGGGATVPLTGLQEEVSALLARSATTSTSFTTPSRPSRNRTRTIAKSWRMPAPPRSRPGHQQGADPRGSRRGTRHSPEGTGPDPPLRSIRGHPAEGGGRATLTPSIPPTAVPRSAEPARAATPRCRPSTPCVPRPPQFPGFRPRAGSPGTPGCRRGLRATRHRHQLPSPTIRPSRQTRPPRS